MSAKILITGISNSGKTTLLKTLKNALVISRDGKPFSLELPHVNIPNELDKNGKNVFLVQTMLDIVEEKINLYKEKFGKNPDTIVFDSVSRIQTDIETSCSNRFDGFKVWDNVQKEINELTGAINELLELDFNIVIIAHSVFDPESKRFVETCKGSFGKTGGFLSTVDYAINIDIVGNKRIVTHRGMHLSRTLMEELPDKEEASKFNLQEYLDKIKGKSKIIQEKWSI